MNYIVMIHMLLVHSKGTHFSFAFKLFLLVKLSEGKYHLFQKMVSISHYMISLDDNIWLNVGLCQDLNAFSFKFSIKEKF